MVAATQEATQNTDQQEGSDNQNGLPPELVIALKKVQDKFLTLGLNDLDQLVVPQSPDRKQS